MEKILRHVGFVRLNHISLNDAFTWISPEPIMLATSVIFFVLFKKLTAPTTTDITESDNRTESEKLDAEVKNRKKYLMFIVGVGKFFQCFVIVYVLISNFRSLRGTHYSLSGCCFAAFNCGWLILPGVPLGIHMVGLLQASKKRICDFNVLHCTFCVLSYVRFIRLSISMASRIIGEKQHVGKV